MKQVGLVLGAGGVAGHAFHCGAIAALGDAGWDARGAALVVGTSAGSGVGTLVRAGLSPSDLFARATGRPMSPNGTALTAGVPVVRRAPVVPRPRLAAPESLGMLRHLWRRPLTAVPGLGVSALVPVGTTSSDELAGRYRRLLPEWPQAPLWICAVRLGDGERVVFGRDQHPPLDPGTAVAASSAIPGVFAPVGLDGERYVDGGVHSTTNADLCAGLEFDAIVVIAPMGGTEPWSAGQSAPLRSFVHAVVGREVAALRRDGTKVVVIEPSPEVVTAAGHDALDPKRLLPVAEAARTTVARQLEASGLPFTS
jgi:NTE family protein